jgi:opacity protein-like surface antigen
MKRFLLAAVSVAALSGAAYAQAPAPNPDRLRFCAGTSDGNYTFAANEIAKRVGGAFPQGVEIILTDGSLDNLRRLNAGGCDVGLAQSDVTALFEAETPGFSAAIAPFHKLYEEYVHLLCPVASGWGRVNDMGKAARDGRGARLVVGPNGSGGAETWRAMRQADVKLYEKVERLPDAVGRASLGMVRDSNNTCVLWISGLNSGGMQAANLMSVNNPRRAPTMRLLDFDDADIRKLRSPAGQPLYQIRNIERVEATQNNPGLYGNLIHDGWGADTVNVLTVSATLMVRNDYRARIGARADALMQAIDDAGPTIWRRVNPQ